MNEFHDLGPVPLDSTAYVPRGFEKKVEAELLRGHWVLLLGPRQHGKTTSILRILNSFQKTGLVTTRVDLQGLPVTANYGQLLYSVAKQIHRNCSQRNGPLTPPVDEGDLQDWLQAALPEGSVPIVIAIDEAASITNDEYRNAFYGQIREISTSRVDAQDGSMLKRLRFLFSGTFRPESLVHPDNSPFNVCERISSDDLTLNHAKDLADHVDPTLAPLVERIYSYVGGQPYLLQRVLRRLASQQDDILGSNLDSILADLENIEYGHLTSIFSKILANVSLTSTVRNLLRAGEIMYTPGDADHDYLQVLGIVRRDANKLQFRCEFYKLVVGASPQFEPEQTVDIPHIQRHSLFPLDSAEVQHMRDSDFQKITISQHDAAVHCYQGGYYRLALTGFGAATEALLLDWLLTVNHTRLATAVTTGMAETDTSKRVNLISHEDRNDPGTWRLVNMINVARQFPVGRNKMEPSHALRDWRNSVHPASAKVNFQDESALLGECLAAAGLFTILLRDIKAIYGTV